MPKPSRGTIWFDRTRQSWRVRVFVDGQPIFRRARSRPEALQIRQMLLMQRDRPAYERLKAGATLLDVSGFTDEQIGTLLMLIESWGYPETDEVPLERADALDRQTGVRSPGGD